MNFKRLVIWATISNIVSWLILELWITRYAEGVAEIGAGFLAGIQILGYIVMAAAYSTKNTTPSKLHPKDCPGHDWQTEYDLISNTKERCTICDAERTIPKSKE